MANDTPKVRIDPDVHAELAVVAREEGREMKWLATEAIRDMLARRAAAALTSEPVAA